MLGNQQTHGSITHELWLLISKKESKPHFKTIDLSYIHTTKPDGYYQCQKC
jgi:hypothetical protein